MRFIKIFYQLLAIFVALFAAITIYEMQNESKKRNLALKVMTEQAIDSCGYGNVESVNLDGFTCKSVKNE